MAECSVCSVLSKVARIQFFLLLKNGKEFFIKIYEEKVAECSVCQFVKSNCLIGFNSRRMGPHGWFVAKPGNSKWIFHKKSD